MSPDDKQFLKEIEKDLPLASRPFKGLLSYIINAKDNGSIRRYGGVLGHRKSGFSFNVMVVFNLPDDITDKIGSRISKKSFVSHCYERDRYDDWHYNLYAMVHAKNKEEGLLFIAELKSIASDHPCETLKSGKEYKKTSLKIL